MKVMVIAPYIYDNNLPEFTKNKTGFGIMVRNIVESIGELADVVLLTRVITSGEKQYKGNFRILPHTWKMILSNANLKNWKNRTKVLYSGKIMLKNRLRHFFYEVDSGCVKRLISIEKPDIIHIHGIGTITDSYIRICEEMEVKYAVTLHGLIGLNNSISVPDYEKKIERDFLMKAAKNEIPVSVISSGMKKRIEKKYLNKNAYNITVIANGTKNIGTNKFEFNHLDNNLIDYDYIKNYSECLKQDNLYPQIIETYYYLQNNKKNGKKIVFFVGNITTNKNQMQAIEVFKNDQTFKNSLLVLWGKEVDGGTVRKNIIDYQLENRVILGGFNEQMKYFWDLCDINLFLSLNDGFGLPIIEGYMQGIPCVTFEDLDAIEDLYFPEAMLKISDRSIESITYALKEAFVKNWDYNEIIKVGKKFSIDFMANEYLNWYKKVVK